MWFKTKIRSLKNKYVLEIYKRSGIRNKLKFFIQTNQLYLVEDLKKQVVNAEGAKQSASQIQVSVLVRWKMIKTEHGDTNLVVQLVRSGSVLDEKLLDYGTQLQSLFGAEMLSKKNLIQCVEYTFLYKKSEEKEVSDLNEKVVFGPRKEIVLNRYQKWEYVGKPHMLIAGNSGSGKSYMLFHLVHEMIREAPLSNIYICDGKFDELKMIASEKFKMPMVANSEEDIVNFIEMTNEFMEERYQKQTKENDAIFLVVDEFAALHGMLEKKEFDRMNKLLKNIILKGRAANIHVLVAMQRASGSNMDLDIRDNTAIRIGLGNLSTENFKMIFGETKNKNEIIKRERGQGYILVDGEDVTLFEAPFIKN